MWKKTSYLLTEHKGSNTIIIMLCLLKNQEQILEEVCDWIMNIVFQTMAGGGGH